MALSWTYFNQLWLKNWIVTCCFIDTRLYGIILVFLSPSLKVEYGYSCCMFCKTTFAAKNFANNDGFCWPWMLAFGYDVTKQPFTVRKIWMLTQGWTVQFSIMRKGGTYDIPSLF